MVAARLVRFIANTRSPISAHLLDFKYDDSERLSTSRSRRVLCNCTRTSGFIAGSL